MLDETMTSIIEIQLRMILTTRILRRKQNYLFCLTFTFCKYKNSTFNFKFILIFFFSITCEEKKRNSFLLKCVSHASLKNRP